MVMDPIYLLAQSVDRWREFVMPESYVRIMQFMDYEPRLVSRLIGDLLRDMRANKSLTMER